MLEQSEKSAVAADFGVAEDQVELDHLISHVLSALSSLDVPLTFFGGTALSRTHLSDPAEGARLSEDVDLFTPERREVAAILDREMPLLLRREFPGTVWDPPLATVRSVEPGQLLTREGMRLRVQLLDTGGDHYHLAEFPTEVREVVLRYGDSPGKALLRVPTIQAFAAMKTIAWFDRRTARDLYDLGSLAILGVLDVQAAAMVRRVSGSTVMPYYFDRLPVDWEAQLAHQTGQLRSPAQCLSAVRQAYAAALGWDENEEQHGASG